MNVSFIKFIEKPYKAYILQVIYVLTGLIFISIVSILFKKSGVNITYPTFLLFAAGYLTVSILLKNLSQIRYYWDLRRIYFVFIGFVIGIIIQFFPVFLGNKSGIRIENILHSLNQIGLIGIGLTVLTVAWEELWFRNPILNQVTKTKNQVIFSVFNGLLFAMLHLLNPKINLFHDGYELILAGTLLTFRYYVSKSFWMPLGIHLGNNMISSLFEKSNLNGNIADTNSELVLRCIAIMIVLAFFYTFWPARKRKHVISP